jgi:hypothetical protein
VDYTPWNYQEKIRISRLTPANGSIHFPRHDVGYRLFLTPTLLFMTAVLLFTDGGHSFLTAPKLALDKQRLMKTRIIILLLIILGYACTPSAIHSSWTPVSRHPATVSKLLIAVILPEKDSLLRRKLELQFSADLNKMGYYAVSASQEFGKESLMKLEQEQTYLALCEKGIDAVMTIAVLDKVKGENELHGRMRGYSNIQYYNRIWNYKHAYKDEVLMKPADGKSLFMEVFVFDLKMLQPVYFADTPSFTPGVSETLLMSYARIIFNDMIKSRMLLRKPRPKAA